MTLVVTFRVAQSVEGQASSLWVTGSNTVPVLLFISFMKVYRCIFGANVIDFEIFKTVIVIIFQNPFILENNTRYPIPP